MAIIKHYTATELKSASILITVQVNVKGHWTAVTKKVKVSKLTTEEWINLISITQK